MDFCTWKNTLFGGFFLLFFFLILKNHVFKQHDKAKCEPEESSKTFDPREIGNLKVSDKIQLALAVGIN